eukprot:TRINITY_DN2070_c0_g1_i2.p1 TRINITY_DN2070_c0_g1~~TRINITY_DN2070_c0_g1_i2.p1  ORF type:complete len:350 (+),score=75.45 TRINITY_DN2070_c0_g1_i2:588-1637(+)
MCLSSLVQDPRTSRRGSDPLYLFPPTRPALPVSDPCLIIRSDNMYSHIHPHLCVVPPYHRPSTCNPLFADEYGWGQSFHFAPRHKNETFEASISRHEHYLAAKMGLKKGDKVLDVGCGVGGPLREIARFSGAHITGINNNGYQISRGQAYNEKCGLDKTCGFLQTDFMNIDVPDQSQDAVYQIEATAHAPDKVACFKEIFRTLKPGGVFAGYEWCMTDKYVPGNEEHEHIRHEICRGNGLPDIATTTEVVEALKAAGFEVEEYEDHALRDDIPWYWPLCGTWGAWFRRTRVGNKMTSLSLRVMETLRIAPRGSHDVTMILEGAATSLIQGGETGTFTPMFFYVARKPSA